MLDETTSPKTEKSSAPEKAPSNASNELPVAEWMQSTVDSGPESIISFNERTSLSALIVYVATKSGENEFRVERRLSDRFNVPNILCLPAAEYENAVRYLVDSI